MTQVYVEKNIYEIIDVLNIDNFLKNINNYIGYWYIIDEGDIPQPVKSINKRAVFDQDVNQIYILSIKGVTNQFEKIEEKTKNQTAQRILAEEDPKKLFDELQEENGFYVKLDGNAVKGEDVEDINGFSDIFNWELVKPAKDTNDVAVYNDNDNGIATIVGLVDNYIRVFNIGIS